MCAARGRARGKKSACMGVRVGAKGVRMAVREACGAEMRKQCVGCDVRGLDNVGELQAVRACRMGQGRGVLQ